MIFSFCLHGTEGCLYLSCDATHYLAKSLCNDHMKCTLIKFPIWLIVALDGEFKDDRVTFSASLSVMNKSYFEDNKELSNTGNFLSIEVFVFVHIFFGEINQLMSHYQVMKCVGVTFCGKNRNSKFLFCLYFGLSI